MKNRCMFLLAMICFALITSPLAFCETVTSSQISAASSNPDSGDLGDVSVTIGVATFSSTGTETPRRNLGWQPQTGQFNPDIIGIQGGGKDGETGALGEEALTIAFENGAVLHRLTLARQGDNDVRVDISGFTSDPGATFSAADPNETDVYPLEYDPSTGTLSVFSREGGVPGGAGLGFVASYHLDFNNPPDVSAITITSPSLFDGAGGLGFGSIEFSPNTPTGGWAFVSSPDIFNNDIADISGGNVPDIAAEFDSNYASNLTQAVGWEPGGVNSITLNMTRAYNQLLSDMKLKAGANTTVFVAAGDLINGRWPQTEAGMLEMFGGADLNESINNAADVYYGWYRELFRQNGFTTLITAIGDHDIGDNNWPLDSERADHVSTMKQAFGRLMVDPLSLPATWNGISSTAPEVSLFSQYDEGSFVTQVNNVLFLTVDVFRHDSPSTRLHPNYGSVDSQVSGDANDPATHLGWIKSILVAADNDSTVDHVVVQGHTPILGGVRKALSSGMMMKDRDGSLLWQTLRQHGPKFGGKVRFYFSGEVHTTTAIRDAESDIVQIVHGNPPLGNGATSYAVFHVDGKLIEVNHYDVDLLPNGGQYWQVSQGLQGGPGGAEPGVLNGTMTIDANGQTVHYESTGILEFVRNQGILLHYGFDEFVGTAYSNTGSLGNVLYTATPNGNPVAGPGVLGDSMNLNGVDEFARTAGQPPILETETRSVSAWIKADSDSNTSARSIFGYGKPSGNFQRFIVSWKVDQVACD